mmetsp:Transcript_59440/g.159114  ORF Transcript_59440/g.159114 Transcript_59440/m.159114 type:complete len:115 (-) Transcript_59440:92-436(-)
MACVVACRTQLAVLLSPFDGGVAPRTGRIANRSSLGMGIPDGCGWLWLSAEERGKAQLGSRVGLSTDLPSSGCAFDLTQLVALACCAVSCIRSDAAGCMLRGFLACGAMGFALV